MSSCLRLCVARGWSSNKSGRTAPSSRRTATRSPPPQRDRAGRKVHYLASHAQQWPLAFRSSMRPGKSKGRGQREREWGSMGPCSKTRPAQRLDGPPPLSINISARRSRGFAPQRWHLAPWLAITPGHPKNRTRVRRPRPRSRPSVRLACALIRLAAGSTAATRRSRPLPYTCGGPTISSGPRDAEWTLAPRQQHRSRRVGVAIRFELAPTRTRGMVPHEWPDGAEPRSRGAGA